MSKSMRVPENLPLDQRLGVLIGMIIRGCWHDGWQEADVLLACERFGFIQIETLTSQQRRRVWARDMGLSPGDLYQTLSQDIAELEYRSRNRARAGTGP